MVVGSAARPFTVSFDDDDQPISSLIAKMKPVNSNKIKSGRKQTSRRKTRSKVRKPKYLSLRLQFSSTHQKSQESLEMTSPSTCTTTSSTRTDKDDSNSKQLHLCPLHPDDYEKEAHDENNMAYLFSAADGGASTLTGLLESTTNMSSSSHINDTSVATTRASQSLTYDAYGGGRQEVALARTALRNKEREPSEERWVRYSEVVERRDDQEVSSCCAAPEDRVQQWSSISNKRLSLKLDYEEILTAWSDKGSLFIHAEAAPPLLPPQSPQIVPDIHDDLLVSPFPNGMMMIRDGGLGNESSSSGCVWSVPELRILGHENEDENERGGGRPIHKLLVGRSTIKAEEPPEQVEEVEGEWKTMGQREASVKRYKEKRHNRLFAKRIRYQVRKINAEKRPRFKGRFVKRS